MLANKALLIHVHITQWTGRKLDKRATETVTSTHATDSKVGNYTKKLLPGCKELERVNLLAGQIRKYFYQETLPWFSDGARIIKSDSYMQFMSEFAKMKSDYDSAVSDFLGAYPYLQVKARLMLGSLYSTEEYPDVSLLGRKFNCEVQIMPLPDVKDFRVEVGDAEREKFQKAMADVQREAMQDCWSRLFGVVQKAAEQLAKPDYRLRDSLLENVSEICALLPRLNISDDPALEEARRKVEYTIASMNPETLRENSTDRQDAALKLAEITKSMGAFMGAPNE